MADNTLNARIKLKYDTYANWESVKATFKPLAGEVIIYQIPAQTTSTGLTPPAVGIKVGNGTDYLKDLPWIQAIAGDVSAWAKAASVPNATLVNNTTIQKKDVVTNSSSTDYATVQEVLSWLKDQIDGLGSGAGSIATQIENEIAKLDVDNLSSGDTGYDANKTHITGFGAGKTLATLTETDGKIGATFQDIAITKSQVTDFPTLGTAAAATVATSAISDSDSSTDLTTKAQVATYVASKTAGITGAMHFKGSTASTITDGGTETVQINDTNLTPTAGDVVLSGSKEFVWTGSAWELLGDEGSYALKTTTITGTNGLTGGGAISSNQTISHAVPSGSSAGTLGSTTDNSGRKYIQTLTTDAYGHVTGATYAAETVTDTTYTFSEGSTDGAFSVTPSGGNAQSVAIHGLANIATSGNVNDLVQTSGDILILNCGSSSTVI